MTGFTVSPVPQLTHPLCDLNAWTAHFRAAEIPVLAQTAEALEASRANEDSVDANSLGDMFEQVARDPGDPVQIAEIIRAAIEGLGGS